MEGLADREIVATLDLYTLHEFETKAHVKIDIDRRVGVEALVAGIRQERKLRADVNQWHERGLQATQTARFELDV